MKLLILDRDGVINYDSDAYIKTLEEWVPIPGSVDAIAQLSKAGWTVAVATNQSGIARGYYPLATLEAMHARLRALVAEQGGEVGLIVYCPHGPDEGCACRKPKPGMLLEIASRFTVDLAYVPVVGDSLRDMEAATSPTDAKRKITVCVKAVSGLLGNTPTVCRASYVHPKVFALFESGEIGNALPGSETKGFEKALIKQLLAV